MDGAEMGGIELALHATNFKLIGSLRRMASFDRLKLSIVGDVEAVAWADVTAF